MKNTAIKICNETIHPGESLSLALPLPQLFSCAPLYMPIKVMHGKYAGPTLLIIAAMHGNEVNGTEIINRLLNMAALSKLRGTLITIPVLNVYGLLNRSRHLPGGIELDRCFPGKKDGTHAARLAHIFSGEIFSMAEYCIDLQTGPLNYTNLPQVYADVSHEKSKALANVFNAPVILNSKGSPGSLRYYAQENNIPYITYEAGEAMRFDEQAIKVGLQGVVNVMYKLEMLPEKASRKERTYKSLVAEKHVWIHSETSGISHSRFKLGQYVKMGEVICVIKDPFGVGESVSVRSPHDGIVIGKNNLPLVHEGEGLFQMAVFQQMDKAANHLEAWKQTNVQKAN